MSVLRYTVPFKPVGNNELYERHAGGVHKSDAAQVFATALAVFGQQARKRARLAPMTGEVDVLVTYYFESARPDGDGPTKQVLDSLQPTNARLKRVGAGILENDRQVRDHHVRRRVDRERPRVEVVVGPAGQVFTLTELLEQETRPA